MAIARSIGATTVNSTKAAPDRPSAPNMNLLIAFRIANVQRRGGPLIAFTPPMLLLHQCSYLPENLHPGHEGATVALKRNVYIVPNNVYFVCNNLSAP